MRFQLINFSKSGEAMVSAEDMQTLQGRLIELSDENLDLISKLKIEQEKAAELPIIRSRLSDAQKAAAAAQREFNKKEEQIRAEFAPQRTKGKSLRVRPPDRNEKQILEAAESKLADGTERFSVLIETEASFIEQLTAHGIREDELTSARDGLKAFIARCDAIQPRFDTCLGVPMHVQDLAARLDQLAAVLSAQRGRRHRLLNWASQTEAVFEHQTMVFREMGDEIMELAKSADAKAAELEGVQTILNDVAAEHSRVLLLLRAEDREIERFKSETESNHQKAKEDGEAVDLRISNVGKLISTLNHDVETHHVSRKKLLQKKLELVRELSKRLVVQRQNCASMEIGSSKVEELTQAVSTEMLEKQDMLAEIKKREDRLKWLQAETQKKSAIITELKKMIKPRSSETPTNQQTLDDFDQLLSNLKVQNECHLENLQIAGFGMGGLEEEKASLMSILGDMNI
jgi:hypothetical protein